MHHFFAKLRLTGISLGLGMAAAALSSSAWAYPAPAPQAAQESPYKDQEEFDIATAANKETDPQKQLDKIKQWEQKYPDSKLAATRDQWKAAASAKMTLGQAQALQATAQAAYGKLGPPELLDSGQKAAQQIADNLDNYFSEANQKAMGATSAQWAAARHIFEMTAHSVLGWVPFVKKTDNARAESEFKKVLTLDKDAAVVSYSLGLAIIRQGDVKRFSEALYQIARALVITGDEALVPAAATQYGTYLDRQYAGYHGDNSGLDELKKAAAAGGPLAPPGFHIESVTEIDAKKYANQEEFDKAHPDVALWRQIRDTLKSGQGETYFGSVKGSEIPPANIGMFKATIVTVNAKDLVVNVDNIAGDATLKFDKALNAKVINAGDTLQFKGVVEAYAKEPYMLTLTIEDPKESIKGLPDGAFSSAPGVKKTAPKKPAARGVKKK